ncbi:hypothetical protein F5Y14DRAFT_395424 [Nemania sp. NC0429]|nr:hypothetical protein F5Y14DRAFT_395424 [Nemania sp. NC0429]
MKKDFLLDEPQSTKMVSNCRSIVLTSRIIDIGGFISSYKASKKELYIRDLLGRETLGQRSSVLKEHRTIGNTEGNGSYAIRAMIFNERTGAESVMDVKYLVGCDDRIYEVDYAHAWDSGELRATSLHTSRYRHSVRTTDACSARRMEDSLLSLEKAEHTRHGLQKKPFFLLIISQRLCTQLDISLTEPHEHLETCPELAFILPGGQY